MRITEAIETAATLDELLLLALRELTQLFDVPRGGVALLDGEDSNGQMICEYPPQVNQSPALQPTDLPLLQRAIRRRQPIVLNDAEQQDRHPRTVELMQAYNIRSALLVPLIAQD